MMAEGQGACACLVTTTLRGPGELGAVCVKPEAATAVFAMPLLSPLFGTRMGCAQTMPERA